MFRNTLITTFRYFFKHKAYSFTNIFGLAIGLATCILIFLFVQDELSYDKFHQNAENIYRLEPHWVGQGEDSHWAASQGSIIPAVISRYPEIVAGHKFHKSYATAVMSYEDNTFREYGIVFADSNFFDMFSYELIQGNPETCLSGPEKIVLTETTAKKYFGDKDPMGEILKSDDRIYMVSGIVKDAPKNSHLQFNMIVSLDDLRSMWDAVDQPGPSTFYSYVKLQNAEALKTIKGKLDKDIWEIYGFIVSGDSANIPEGYTAEFIFNPVTDIHLNGHAEKELEANSDRQYIYIFSIVAIFVLIIASINYMNLATARSANRAREIGVKKVLGASKSKIFNQFMGESFLMGLIAMLLALFIVFLILPSYNVFTGKELTLNVLENSPLLISLILIWIVVSFLSGSYPSIYLSRFNPLRVLYSNSIAATKSKTTLNFRRVLVVFQFVISILLIIGAMTVYKQLQFIQDKGLGFDKEQLIVIPMAGQMDPDKVLAFKNELLMEPEVISSSSSNAVPGMRIHVLGIRLPDQAEKNLEQNEEGDDFIGIRVLSTDVDIVKTLGLEMADGRAFSRDFPNDPENAFIINEAAVREFELENPVGERLAYNYAMEEDKVGHIVGVVKDFHYASLHTEVEPLMIHIYPRFDRYLSIRVLSKDIQNTLDKLADKWMNDFPEVPFDHFFMDSYYDNMYKTEMNMGKIIAYFTILAIIIACLGLFGLAAYITEQRTKEIGIRKVLGASISTIIQTLSKEFVILVLIANLLAWIPAWYFLSQWLDGFVFRTGLSWWLFILSAIISLAIALLIVGFQAYRAARMNPVEAIKYE